MTDITNLKNVFSGAIITPEDTAYTTARVTYTTTGNPAMIVYPNTIEDIKAALEFATDNKLVLSVRSGGHNGLDYSTNDGGMVIDMKAFSNVDVTDKEKSIVRVGSGAVWGEVAEALALHGLVISAGDTSSVGVGGLTLGGGIGIMVRKYGLAIDQLVGAELVTADGRVLQLNEHENAELFWAIRGGGGNFGIITHFDFQASPLSGVHFGTVMYQLTDIRSLLTNWRSVSRDASVDVTTTLVVMPGFGGNPPFAQLFFCFAGEDDAAHTALEPFLSLAPVTLQQVASMPYKQALQDAHPPAGVVGMVKNGLVQEVNEDIIDILTTTYTNTTNKMMFLRSLGGKMNETEADATAFSHRSCEALLVCAAFVPPTMSAEDRLQEIRFFDPIGEKCIGAYSNFFTLYDEHDLARMYPGATLVRLQNIKRQYDPDNLFSRNIAL